PRDGNGGAWSKLVALRPSRNGEPDSGVWLVRTSAPPKGRRKVGNLARACARFVPNFGPEAGRKWTIRKKTGRFNVGGPLGGISRRPLGHGFPCGPFRLPCCRTPDARPGLRSTVRDLVR